MLSRQSCVSILDNLCWQELNIQQCSGVQCTKEMTSSPESSAQARSRSGSVTMEEVEAAVFGDFVPVEAIEVCQIKG